jgi:hypothetical protein
MESEKIILCDCVEKLEAEITTLMEKKTGKEVAEPVKLSPKFLYSQSYPLYFKAGGKVYHGKGVRNFNINIALRYCPFCGKNVCRID